MKKKVVKKAYLKKLADKSKIKYTILKLEFVFVNLFKLCAIL